MRRVLKIASWSIAALLLLATILGGAVLVAGNTDSGRQLLERLTARLSHGRVVIAGLSGPFPAAIDVRQLSLQDAAGTWLSADRLSLRWSPWRLLWRQVQVEQLQIARLQIVRRPQSQVATRQGRSTSVPHIDVARLGIDELDLGAALAGTAASLRVQGSGNWGSWQDAALTLSARRIDGPGDYELTLQFDRAQMNAQLALQEPRGGPLANLLQVPGLGELALQARLEGPRAREALNLAVSAGALRGHAQGVLDLTQQSADLELSVNAAAMMLRQGLSWQSITLQGQWHGTLAKSDARAQLQIVALQAAGTQVQRLDADMQAKSGAARLNATVNGLRLPGPQPQLLQNTPLTLQADVRLDEASRPVVYTVTHQLFTLRGRADTAGHRKAQLSLTLPALAPFADLIGVAVQGNATLNATVDEERKAMRIALDGRIAVHDGAAPWPALLGDGAQLTVAALWKAGEGGWSSRPIQIERAQLNGRTLTASLQGSDADGALDAKWSLSLADVAALTPALAGTLAASGRVNGKHRALNVDANAQAVLTPKGAPRGTVTASLRVQGVPSAASGSLMVHGTLDGAPLALEAQFERGQDRGLHAAIRVADWKSAHIEGELRSAADGQQARGHFSLRLSRLEDLQHLVGPPLQGGVVGSLDLRPVDGKTHAQLELEAQHVVAGGLAAEAQLTASGVIDALALRLNAQFPDLKGERATVLSSGTLDISTRSLLLAAAQADYHGQTLRLLAPARLSFAAGLTVDRLRLGMQQAVFELRGRYSPLLNLNAALRNVTPAVVNAFRPGLLREGTLQADLTLRGSTTMPQGRAQVTATGLRLQSAAARALPAAQLHASAQFTGDSATVAAQVDDGPQTQLSVSGRVPFVKTGQIELKASGAIDVALLNPWLEASGRRAAGRLNLEANMNGALAAPRISGTVQLVHGDLRDYTQGVHLSDVAASLQGAGGALRLVNFTARAGGGSLSMSGTVGVLQAGTPVDLQLTAKNAQPIASNLITATVDADLSLRGRARERLDLAGRIQISRADIGIPSSFPPEVAVLDVRRPGKAAQDAPPMPLTIGLDVTLQAPRAIFVQGRGLDAELGGDLHLSGTTAAPLASGGFDLQRGSFALASTKLMFTSGRVSFNGTGLNKKIDPTLDFVAETTAANVTATLKISGYADAPQFELTSSPELPQDEILARLLFGESVTQLSALQVAQIGAALASLSGGSGLNPLATVQRRLRLDRLSVSGSNGTDNSGTRVEAGRYVTDRVYVGAKQSSTGSTQLRVEVELSKHLKLQTAVGNGGGSVQGATPENDPGNSVGVTYQFEY